MKYQIRAKDVKEYVYLVRKRIEQIEELISIKQEYMKNELKWESMAGNEFKKAYQKELNMQIAYCNSLKMFVEIYDKGIKVFGESLKEIKKKFKELQEENMNLLNGEIDENKY